MTPELVQWQRLSPINKLVQCWFTHPCLDWMEQQDWSEKTIIMFGAGLGDGWLARKCKQLIIVERNEEWLKKSSDYALSNGAYNIVYYLRHCNDSSGHAAYYTKLPIEVDIIINDDAYRTELCQVAVDYFSKKKGGGILICDNWVQSFVWMSPKAEEIMQPYTDKALIFEQADHLDNDGVNKWKTAVFFIQ